MVGSDSCLHMPLWGYDMRNPVASEAKTMAQWTLRGLEGLRFPVEIPPPGQCASFCPWSSNSAGSGHKDHICPIL